MAKSGRSMSIRDACKTCEISDVPNQVPLAELQPKYNLLKVASSLALAQSALSYQVFEQFSAFHIFQNEVP
jgi:hypothetical protein